MPPLRVLTFTTLYPNAEMPNLGVFVENRLRQTLKRHDFQVSVVAPVPFFPFSSPMFGSYARYSRVPAREERYGVAVHHPRYLVIPKVGMTVAAQLLYRAGLAACRHLGFDKTSIDVIDAHYFYPDGVAAALLSEALDIPFIVTARGTDLNLLPTFPSVRRQILWAAKRAAAVVTVSSALRQRMLDLGGEPSQSAVLRNGVDLDQFKPKDRAGARKKFGVDGYTVVSVGNLVPLKGHDLTIDAVASIPDCSLLIAGGGPLREALQAKVAALGVGERVRLLGEVPHGELADLFSAADASVLMSEREGWPNVLLESMACGTPAIATRVGGTPEAITSAEAGILLEERSAGALARAIETLRKHPPNRSATRAHAERFGWAAVAAGNFALLEAASNARGAPFAADLVASRAMGLA